MVNWPWCFRPTWQLTFLHKRARTLNPLLGCCNMSGGAAWDAALAAPTTTTLGHISISSHLNMPHKASPHKVSSHSQSHKVGPTFSTHEPFNHRPKLQQGRASDSMQCQSGRGLQQLRIQRPHAHLNCFLSLELKTKAT